jgi:hypothetical protein
MRKITIDNLIEYRRKKTDNTRFTILHNSQKEKVKKPGEIGGHYWVCCLSAVKSVFKTDDKNFLAIKISELASRIKKTSYERTKKRWRQSITILSNLNDYDFEGIKPVGEIHFLKKPSDKSILTINNLPVEADPTYIYSFVCKDFKGVGAVWFIAKKGGFRKDELAMFCDIMYRYLISNFSTKYEINPRYCVAVDIVNGQDVNYLELIDGHVNHLLDQTVGEVETALVELKYL